VAERSLAQPKRRLERVGHPERAERGLDRRAPALRRGADERDLLRCEAAADQCEDLLGDELDRAPRSGALQEADRSLERRRRAGRVDEERPLEIRERGRVYRGAVGWRKLLDVPLRQAGEVLRSRPQRLEGGAAGLVGQRDRHVRSSGESLDERPFGPGQVLEPVGEDRLAVPRVEVAAEPFDRERPQQIAVDQPEPLELLAVGGVEAAEVAFRLLGGEQA
jgi:hypothetical protein